ncbi:MAG TPA: ABC transporter permease [Bryobacteraceae bacterium]|nr:ABC transporter permease [Bryobacteraceae bacterium]
MQRWQIALRTLIRRPGYTVTAMLMLIMGIGATTTLFSLVDTVLLKPLPYPDSDRLVTVYETQPSKSDQENLIAPARLVDWARMNQTFDALSAMYTENVTDTSGTEPERLAGRRVALGYFDVLATKPLLGRTFHPNEEVYGGPLVAVISYGMWTRRYGQDPATVGKRLVIAGAGCTIIGVMPKEFTTATIDLWLPAQINPVLMRIREARFYNGVGRLKPGVTMQQAQADLARVQHQLGEQFPQTDKDWSASIRDLKEARVGDYRKTLLLVFGAVGLLLLIAVANIAGLTLAQLHQREREMAIRSSVGASRQQVIATVMREVLLIAAGGALFGGAVAMWGVKLMASIFADLPRMSELRFDWRALLFTALVSLAAAVVFGAVPAIQSTRADLAPALAESSRSVSGGRRRLQRGLVIAQLAVTMVLLSSAGLLLRSYYNLTHVDSGFNTAHTITFHVGAAWNENRDRIGQLQMRILEELRRLPGVESAGITSFLPATGATSRSQVQVEGFQNTGQSATFTIGGRTIGGAYLQALKVPLLAGEWCPALRPFESNGSTKSLVNRQFVEQYARGQNLLGRHTLYPLSTQANPPMNEIVGVVGDLREDSLSVVPAPYVYDCASAGSWPDPEYVVRTRGDARAVMQQVRQVVHGIDPNRAVFGMKLLDTLMDDALEQPRLNARFLALFAATAMLLASVGIYSLISLVVTARTREIGVRIALGAGRGEIMRLIFAGAGRLLAAGILLGLALTTGAERLIKSVLFGVSPLDALTLGEGVLVLVTVTTIAAFLPARRAAEIDPLDAIRIE